MVETTVLPLSTSGEAPEMLLIERYDVIETFAATTANPAFRSSVAKVPERFGVNPIAFRNAVTCLSNFDRDRR